MMTLVVGGPSCSGLYTSWNEIPEMGMSFKVNSPFGPLPLIVGSSLGLVVVVGVGGVAGTAGVELLLAGVLLLAVSSEEEDDDDEEVLGSGERDRLAWLVSWLAAAVFRTGVPCLRIGAVADAGALSLAGSTTLTDFLDGSDPFC